MFQPKHVDNKVEYYPVKVYFGYLLRLYLFVRFKTTHGFITFIWFINQTIYLSIKKLIVLKSISKTIVKLM